MPRPAGWLVRTKLTISSLLLLALCAGVRADDAIGVTHAYGFYHDVAQPVLRCALNDSEAAQQDKWGWGIMASTSDSTWTAISINYTTTVPPTAKEISRCVNEISKSEPTRRYLNSFVNAVHRNNYKGLARQWEIWVAGKVVCFLSVPEPAK